METKTETRTYHIKSSEKCYRFKPDAFCSHAPASKGIYELVTFDEAHNPKILYIGPAFEKGILESLEGHAMGTMKPTSEELFAAYPNLYFDYIADWDARTLEDAQDVYWWLIQKYKPAYNDVPTIQHSGRPGTIHVFDAE